MSITITIIDSKNIKNGDSSLLGSDTMSLELSAVAQLPSKQQATLTQQQSITYLSS